MWFNIILSKIAVGRPLKMATTTLHALSKMYPSAFILSFWIRYVRVVNPMTAQIITSVQGSPVDIECLQSTRFLLGSFRHVSDGHHNTAKSRISKGQHCATSVSSFVVMCNRFTIPLYSTLLREVELMNTVLTFPTAANNVVPLKRVLGKLKICSFSD